jgi:serine/threonine protein kinase/Tfp pilus assembly protein PilF
MSPTPIRQDESLESLVALVVDEFRERQRQGEQPNVEEYASRYPQAAELLRKVLASWQLMGLSGAGGFAGSFPGSEEPVSGLLGDFRVVREVGRGGMAVVYEAEQISLGRRVALKVLPLAAMMDPRHIQRFHNEARAAAGLHHSNIVPVFYVGCERGVHFYAMQFIDGMTLASVLRDLRQEGRQRPEQRAAPLAGAEEATAPHVPARPAETLVEAALSTERSSNRQVYFRSVARLGVQAAEALDYAHERGVVHRDVKPGNLLLDSEGNLWVTDFGLAHLQHAEGSLTMTGDLVGTLRYMSPEQALARRVVIDHRTDVYSLGATLYELLTLRPACDGKDRQELLHQVAFEEPVPPRKLDKSIPAELETIVLEAMEKDPAERYATAQELANDLRRWLEDRPIKARPPSLRQVTLKWARRHRAAVWSVALSLLAAVVVLAGSVGWVVADRALRRQKAIEEANQAGDDVAQLRREGRWAAALTVTRRVQTLLAGVGADPVLLRQFHELSRDLQMAADLEEIRLRNYEGNHRDFDWKFQDTEYAMAFRAFGIDVEDLEPAEAAKRIKKRSIAEELTAALDVWANRRGHARRDRSSGERLRAVARLADPNPRRNRVRDAVDRRQRKVLEELAAGYNVNLPPTTISLLVGGLLSVGAKEAAVTLLRKAQRLHPDDLWINHDLALFLQATKPPRLEEAMRYYTVVLAPRPHNAGINNDLGNVLQEKGEVEEAIACFKRAIDLDPKLTLAYFNLGNALKALGKVDEAIGCYRKAVAIDPKNIVLVNLGDALHHKGKVDEAIECYHRAIALDPRDGAAHVNLGAVLNARGKLDEGIACFRTAIALDPNLAPAHLNLGLALHGKGEVDEAVECYNRAVARDPRYAYAFGLLGEALMQQGKFIEAQKALRSCLALLPPRHPRRDYTSWRLRQCRQLINADTKLKSFLAGKEAPDDPAMKVQMAFLAQQPFNQCNRGAVRLYRDAFARQPRLAEAHRYNAACAAALAGCGQGKDTANLSEKERARLRQQALDWLRAGLKAHRKHLRRGWPGVAGQTHKVLMHWRQDYDLAGVRDKGPLARLPAAHRQAWQQLWADVADTLAQARQAAAPQKPPDREDLLPQPQTEISRQP